ncbi:hypothetical protein B0H13DRAFT_1620928 [Mycena leptocephala]|nr:hypothetical protein B0H13DRAFT_1620928 [Mycena leptocephala]
MNVPPAVHDTPSQPPPYVLDGERGVRHRFSLLDKRGKQWGVFTLESGARSANSVPLFYEDDTIHGSFETLIEKDDSMRSVTVKVAGSVITGTMVDDRTTFLKLSTVLWTRPAAPPGIGRAVWPFSIALPSEVTILHSGQPSTFRLPENFLERHTRVTVLYEISFTLSRGMFRPDSHFKTRFRYVPCTRPDPPSALCQRAYRLNRPLRGPTRDPEGWETGGTAMAHGHVFKTRQAVVQYSLSLARPLCYTRGSVIPCWIALSSGDTEALEMHASPDALVVHLRRCVRWQNTELPGIQSVEGTTALTAVALAAWWPRPEDPRTDAYTRVLEGELRVPDDLVSSSAMGTFSISYTVDVSPPDRIGFTPVNDGALISVPVEVATMYTANGLRPVAYAPPSYDVFTPRTLAGPSEGAMYTYAGGVNMGR